MFFLKQRRRLTRYMLIRVLRGHIRIKQKGKSQLVQVIKNEICESILQLRLAQEVNNNGSISRVDNSYAQFFYSKVLNIYFNKSLLFSLGSNYSLIYPLPRGSQIVIENNGVKVNRFFCSLLWISAVLFFYMLGFSALIKYNFDFLLSRQVEKNFVDKKLVLYNVNSSCVSSQLEPHKKNLTNWCFNFFKLPANTLIYHDAASTKNVNGLININTKLGLSLGFYPRNSIQLLLFNTKALSFLLSSFLSLFFKSGVKSILIASKIDCLAFNASSISAETVFCFNLSNYILRPNWLDLAEKRGCKVAFCMYSTNTEVIPLKKTDDLVLGFQFLSWKTVYVWDKYQADFFRQNNRFKDIDIKEVGPIQISDAVGPISIDCSNPVTCAIFDIQPYRLSHYAALGTPNSYYDGATAIKFLTDLDKVLSDFYINCVIKRKRDAGSIVRKNYHTLIDKLLCKGWKEYPCDSSPGHLIRQVKLVVAMPFTSVALEASAMGIPAVYYDPFGEIINPHQLSHGIPVVTTTDSLKSWIESIVS